MKKKKLFTCFAVSAMSLVTLCACTASTEQNTEQNGSGVVTDIVLTEPEDVYGIGAVTAVRLLGSEGMTQALQGRSTVRAVVASDSHDYTTGNHYDYRQEYDHHYDYYHRYDYDHRYDYYYQWHQNHGGYPYGSYEEDAAETDDTEIKEQIEKFNEYFNAIDCFLGEDLVTTVACENTDEGAYAEYETKLTVTGKDFDGNDVVHILYYTETLIKSKDKGEEAEEKYVLNGIMIVDGTDYLLSGEREYESDGRESENELIIRAHSPENENNYVEMKQEYSEENGETQCKYVYGLYMNHSLVEETSIKFQTEQKGDKIQTEYELEFRSGESRGKYKIVRSIVDNVTVMNVRYEINGTNGMFFIKEFVDEQGEKYYEYLFSDHSIRTFARHH